MRESVRPPPEPEGLPLAVCYRPAWPLRRLRRAVWARVAAPLVGAAIARAPLPPPPDDDDDGSDDVPSAVAAAAAGGGTGGSKAERALQKRQTAKLVKVVEMTWRIWIASLNH